VRFKRFAQGLRAGRVESREGVEHRDEPTTCTPGRRAGRVGAVARDVQRFAHGASLPVAPDDERVRALGPSARRVLESHVDRGGRARVHVDHAAVPDDAAAALRECLDEAGPSVGLSATSPAFLGRVGVAYGF
jgi:hypothetical protein